MKKMEGSWGIPGLLVGVSSDLEEVSPRRWWGHWAVSRWRYGFCDRRAAPGCLVHLVSERGDVCLPRVDQKGEPGGVPGVEGGVTREAGKLREVLRAAW